MGRSYKPKWVTNLVKRWRQYLVQDVVDVVNAVDSNVLSLREAERQNSVPASTIGRKLKIKRSGGDPAEVINGGFQPVFNKEEEDELVEYLLAASDM